MDMDRRTRFRLALMIVGVVTVLEGVVRAAPELPASAWVLVGFLLLAGGLA
jgi:hypothetical protein